MAESFHILFRAHPLLPISSIPNIITSPIHSRFKSHRHMLTRPSIWIYLEPVNVLYFGAQKPSKRRPKLESKQGSFAFEVYNVPWKSNHHFYKFLYEPPFFQGFYHHPKGTTMFKVVVEFTGIYRMYIHIQFGCGSFPSHFFSQVSMVQRDAKLLRRLKHRPPGTTHPSREPGNRVGLFRAEGDGGGGLHPLVFFTGW